MINKLFPAPVSKCENIQRHFCEFDQLIEDVKAASSKTIRLVKANGHALDKVRQ